MAGLAYPYNPEKSNESATESSELKTFFGDDDGASSVYQKITDKMVTCRIQPEELQADENVPLYSSRILGTYLEYLQEYHPDLEIDAILQDSGITRHEVEDPGHWFTQTQADRFHDIIADRTGNPHIARDAGRFTLSTERIGAAKQYALGMISVASIYLMIGKLAKTMSRGAEMDARKLGKNSVEIVSTPTPGTVEKPYQCQNRLGTIEAVAKFFTNNFPKVEHSSCVHKGAECCRYTITWEKTPSFIWKRIRDIMLFGSLTASLLFFPLISLESWAALVLASIFLFLILFLYSDRLEKKELIKTIETQGNAAKDLLDEVNLRHSNALLIQETGQAISKILDVDRIIDTVVGVMQKHLYYDRGLIMLADPTKSRLQFISGFGYTEDQEVILCNTEFNLGNPDAKGHLVRSFNEKKPFLVKDVAKIENDLSERSRKFVRQMDVRSFICVPIVYEKEALGVLAVENAHFHNRLDQSEISLLMGVASQTATSIINARSFETIKESERQYRLLADNISDVIWTMNLSTLKFSFVSPSIERLQGFTPKEFMALELDEILPPDSFLIAQSIIAEELENDKSESADPHRSRTLELENYCKNGSTIWVEMTASFLRDESGTAVAILGASRDISERRQASLERKKLEAKLQQAYKMEAIGTLAGGIAHDFNNILAAVLGYTEMALEDAQPGSLIHKNLQEVFTAGNRAKDLVKQILAFSRQAEPELKPVQVDLIIREVIKLLRASLPSTIEIRQKIKSNSATLADPTHIHQVLMNLCTNADHAMHETGGVLEVGLEDVTIDSGFEARKLDVKPGAYLCLKVGDTGHGMPEEIRQRIFEPFFTTKGRDKGTGMGLAVVHGIVKSHGGGIHVQSKPGTGTIFEVFLPIIQSEENTGVNTGNRLATGNERVLLVDDEKSLVDLGRQMLERLGYSVACRTSSVEALELFKTRPDSFDLVITDMTMPNLTGDRLAIELINIRPDIPIILCTGFSDQINEHKAGEMGIRKFILKPIVMTVLAETVRSALDGE
jgi:PAS domain S-box-containing protein